MKNEAILQELERNAELSCLWLTPEEKTALAEDLTSLLEFADGLGDIPSEEPSMEAGVPLTELCEDTAEQGFFGASLLSGEYVSVPSLGKEDGNA